MQSGHEPSRFHLDVPEGAVLALALSVAMAAAVRASVPPVPFDPPEIRAAIQVGSAPLPLPIPDDVAGMIADMRLHD